MSVLSIKFYSMCITISFDFVQYFLVISQIMSVTIASNSCAACSLLLELCPMKKEGFGSKPEAQVYG